MCIPFQGETGPVPLPTQPAIGPHLSKKESQRLILNAIEQAKKTSPDSADSVCSTCGMPTVCLSASEKCLPGGRPGSAAAHAMLICENAHHSACTDARMGFTQECNCRIQIPRVEPILTDEQATAMRDMVSSDHRVLILTGFNHFDETNSVYHQSLVSAFEAAGIAFDSYRATNREDYLARLLGSGKYNVLVVDTLDDGGMAKHGQMFSGNSFMTLFHWVRFGGKLIYVHSEGEGVEWMLQTILGKPWHFCGDYYRRCKHQGNALPHLSLDILRGRDDSENEDEEASAYFEGGGIYKMSNYINMKAAMLSGVDTTDKLYSPAEGARALSAVPGFGGHIVPAHRTGIAVARHEQGVVCYVGDVNAELKVIRLVLHIISQSLIV